MSYPATAPPAHVRRRRWPWVLLVVVVILVGLLVVADRVALSLAEGRAASTLQSSQNLDHEPDVSVHGFPFLTQLAARRFGDITVDAHDVTVGSGQVSLEQVDGDLRDVTVSGDYSTFHVDHATASGTMSFAELSQLLHLPIRYGAGGRIVATPSVHVLGRTFHATVSAAARVTNQRLRFDGVSVDGVHLPSAATNALSAVFDRTVSLAGLPFDVQVTGLSVRPTGLELDLAGQDITYRR